MKNIKTNTLWLIPTVILVLLLLQQCRKNKETRGINNTLTEELQTSRNNEGEHVAKMAAFQTRRAQDFVNFATRDSLTLALQKEVKDMKKYLKKQGSVTNITNITHVTAAAETEIIPTDDKNFPNYKSKFNLDGWVYGETLATKDLTKLSLTVKNEYSVVVGSEKTGFLGLGKRNPFVQVTNKNPYTETKTLKSYQVKMPPPKRFGLGVFVGYGIGANLQVGPVIAVGGSFNLIRF